MNADPGLAAKMAEVEPTELEMLRVNDLLVGLDDAAFEAFAQRCHFVRLAADESLFETGSEPEGVFFVIAGKIRISNPGEKALDISYGDVGAGGWFGEIASIDRGARSASARAVDDSAVAVAPRAVFLNLLLEHRHIAVKVLESMATVIRSSNSRLTQISLFSGVQRVYQELLQLAELDASQGQWLIADVPNHDRLAEKATTSKETVARALSQLLQGGVAKRSQGRLKILNYEELRRLATQI